MVRCLLVLLLGGCRGLLGIDDVQVTGDDAPPPIDTPTDGRTCFGAERVEVCADVDELAPTLSLAGQLIDTDTDERCLREHSFCVLASGGDLTIPVNGEPVRARGQRALVLFAIGNITIESIVDVASRRGAIAGAGANMPCTGGTLPQSLAGGGGGGGGFGGTFGELGGSGGASETDDPSMPAAGGVAAPVVTIDSFRGGCEGSDGGSFGAALGGVGGDGGGAIWVLAAGTITISGSINASGAGGSGATGNDQGGGGGGSGGMIGLEAPAITISNTGQVWADGGGGGEGNGLGMMGGAGEDSTGPNQSADGGKLLAAAGDGGQGGRRWSDAKVGQGHDDGGGGGGGGGVGIILIRGTLTTQGSISPDPTLVP